MSQVISGVEVEDEVYEHLRDMLEGISHKYHGWGGLVDEDIEMELWIKALEVIAYHQEVNLNLIARCCYNRALDMCRYAKVRNIEGVFDHGVLDVCKDGDTSGGHVTYVLTKTPNDDFSTAVVNEMIDLFPEGSKERTYVELVAMHVCAYSGDEYYDEASKLFGDERIEKELALKLGYKDDTSSGYRKMRYKVRNAIAEYRRQSDY